MPEEPFSQIGENWSPRRKLTSVLRSLRMEVPARLHQARFDEMLEALEAHGIEAAVEDVALHVGDAHPGIHARLRLRRAPAAHASTRAAARSARDGARLTAFRLENFKSFKEATLPLAELTLLIGANASGKSNALEALQLLSWMASGQKLWSIRSAIDEGKLGLRGTAQGLLWQIDVAAKLGCELSFPGMERSLAFDVGLRVDQDALRIVFEEMRDSGESLPLYRVASPAPPHGREMSVEYNNFARGKNKPRITCVDEQPVFMQLGTPARFGATHAKSQRVIPHAVEELRKALDGILFLDPSPRAMRGYSYKTATALASDGRNLSGVLYTLTEEQAKKDSVLEFISSLPEQDITDLRYVETPRDEVMVQLEETFGKTRVFREAALLSDGTLRVLAIAAAMLSVPDGTLVVIEEIDNGVHPSRAAGLLERIRAVAASKELRVLLTTHNPALLDALPNPALPKVVACFRDPESGSSRLVRLEDLEAYPDIVAGGPLGRLVTRGVLDRLVKSQRSREDRVEDGLRWVDQVLGGDAS